MAGILITSLLSLATNLLPSITASVQAPSSSSSNSNNSEKGRARAVEEELERLVRTLKLIKATLYDAEEREIRDRSVKHWLKELKKVAYDAEDVLSEYRYELTRVQVEARKAYQDPGSHKREQIEASSSSSSSNYNNSEKGRAVEQDLEWLMRTLKGIKDTLYDAEERKIRDRSIKLWLKELKKVAYDAEDVLGEYRYKVTRVQVEARKASQASGSYKREQIEYIVSIPDGMVDRLKKIRSQFDEIAKDREALQLKESDGVRRPDYKIVRPPTGHMVDEASIFGRDAEIIEVIDILLSEKEKSFSVISIVGKGGLGKTTIAELVYKDERVSRCFDLLGWVCVSEEFDVSRLIKATVESVSTINHGASELSPLQEKLAQTVKGKKILLVLDDVWNENQSLWELFRVPFKEANMVRILVTTRNKKVAQVMQTTYLFSPTNLPEDSCWQLFQRYAFSGTSDTVQTHLVDMGRKIMRKCGGLPLAVKSIASLLRHETDEEGWREILESDLWESIPSNDIFPALQISYDHLPPHLKPCFLFCSMYPKDYELEKMHLIELWISHGYIESRGKRKIEEIAGEYFEELQERSFLDEFSDFFKNKRCKLHDIIHDLARVNSENDHYSVEINQPLNTREGNVPRETYHLYASGFMGYVNQILQQNLKGLRTLSMDLRSTDLRAWNTMDRISKLSECYKEGLRDVQICNLTKFEALRVLDLKGYLTRIPDSISELKHLAYLGITSFDLRMLPLSIGLLYNLQTLILDCHSLEYLPESIGDLLNLHFLNIKSSNLRNLPTSLGSLSNLLRLVIIGDNFLDYVLHGLVNFPAIKTMQARLRVRTVAWLKEMTDLEGTLTIYGVSNLEDVPCANLRNKCKLETLDLCWDSNSYRLNLNEKSKLILTPKLEASEDEWDGVDDADTPKLEASKDEWVGVDDADFSSEDEWDGVDDADFSLLESLQPHPNLKTLQLRHYPSATLPGWMRDPSSLQSIQEVWLDGCYNIQSLPFNNLHTLKHLTIWSCDSIQVLQLEQLPSQLEELNIKWCRHLELITGLGNLDMLAKLDIFGCKVLKSIRMDGLQLVESTKSIGDSSKENPHIGQQSISSLTTLKIEYCKLLCVLPDGLIPSGPCCHVRVHRCGGCPDIQIGDIYELSDDDD